MILSIREIHLAWIHLERAAIVRTIHILRSQMEMQVGQLVAVGTIVDFLRIESLLHRTRHLSHVCHEGITLLVRKFIQIVHMAIISHQATTAVCLFFK